jgi:peptidoglycan/LPS O-acetylase OafA/YrhL
MFMLNAFYGAFAPACFVLLGLWVVVVQIRMDDWRGSVFHLKRSYGVALHFALPGVMSLAALIDPSDPDFWRVSFAIVALGGAVVLAMVSGRPAQPDGATAPTALPRLTGSFSLAAYVLAIALYVLVAVLAFAGGTAVLRAEAFLLIALVFLGFNAGWLLLFEESKTAQSAAVGRDAPATPAPGPQPDVQSP